MIRNQVTGRCYIGSAINLGRRERAHFTKLAAGRHHSRRLQASFNKHGRDAFVFFPLCFVPDAARLIEVEQGYIESFGSARQGVGYNMNPVAGSRLGSRQPPAAVERVRAAKTGKPMSEEAKRNHKAAMNKPETKEKLRAAVLGKKQSAETVKKRTAGQIGRKMPRDGVERSRIARTGQARPDVAQWAPARFAMFNTEQVAAIRADRAAGMTYQSLADRYGCSIGTAHFAVNGTGAFYGAIGA